MNILQYGANGYFLGDWKKSGHNVLLVGERQTCDIPINSVISAKYLLEICREKGFVPDIFFHADDSTLPHLYNVEELEIPTVFYSIDTYCHDWHGGYSASFDHILHAQGEEREKFVVHTVGHGDCIEHFPLFARFFTEGESKEEWLENRDIPVAFVGNIGHKNNPDRHVFFTMFRKFQPIFITTGNFVPVFRRARIILNQSAVGELNFRTFEAMALGCACLADNMPDEKNNIAEIFNFGKNSLPAYPRMDVAKAVDYCRHWLSKEKERDLHEIAMEGQRLVQEKHSVEARSRRLEEIFLQCIQEKTWQKRLQSLEARKKSIAGAFCFLSGQQSLDAGLLSAYASIYRKYGR